MTFKVDVVTGLAICIGLIKMLSKFCIAAGLLLQAASKIGNLD